MEEAFTKQFVVYGAFAFLCQFGYLMVCTGSVRQANVRAMLLKQFLTVSVGALAFYILGFSLAFRGGNWFVGGDDFSLGASIARTDHHVWFFEFAHASLAATIAANAVAERTKFEAHALATFFITGWVYPVVAHWVWSPKGWLSAIGFSEDPFYESGLIDIGGSGVVYMVGGLSGLAGALIVHARKKKFSSDGKALDIPGNSSSWVLLGSVFIWFCWYSINLGRTRVFSDNDEAPQICAVNTTLSGVLGGLASLLLARWTFSGEDYVVWDVISTGNGILAGLVSISASCALVPSWAALLIGLIGGIIYFATSQIIPDCMKVDDQLDSISVHTLTGAWGIIASGCFVKGDLLDNLSGGTMSARHEGIQGFLWGGNGRLLAVAITGVISIILWVLLNMLPFFYCAKIMGILEVALDDDARGFQTSTQDLVSEARRMEIQEHERRARIEINELKMHIEELKQAPSPSQTA